MAVIEVRACKCEVCGHVWLPETFEPIPVRCPSRLCRSTRWNANGARSAAAHIKEATAASAVLDAVGPTINASSPATQRGKVNTSAAVSDLRAKIASMTAPARPQVEQTAASEPEPYVNPRQLCLEQAGPNPTDRCRLLRGHDGRHNMTAPKP